MTNDAEPIVDRRRRLLRAWIDTRYGGVQAAFVGDTGINQGELSGLLKTKSFGEKRARALEVLAKMPHRYLDQSSVDDRTPESKISELQSNIDSLTAVLAALIGITAKHRPIEGEELARAIRGNQSLDLVRHNLAADLLSMLDPTDTSPAKSVARARKRSLF